MTQQLTSLTATIDLSIKKEPSTSFENTVAEAIDEIFTSFGENVKRATYSYIETNDGIKKEQIPYHIEGFTNAIESIFGDAAKLVELKIIENLQNKVKGFCYKSKSKEMLFAEYLEEMRKYLYWRNMLPNV